MARRYNSRHNLTWFAPRSCWKKYHRGTVYYLGKGFCKSKSDKDGYGYALREWIQVLSNLDPSPEALAEPLFANPVDGRLGIAFATNYRAMRGKLATPLPAKPAELPATISGLIDAFLAECRVSAASGQMSPSMYDDLRHRLGDFAAYCEDQETTGVADLGTSLLAGYRQAQLSLLGLSKEQGGIAPISARKRLQYVARFVNWCVEREALDSLPRNVNKNFTAVKVAPPKPVFLTVPQIQQIYAAASPLLKACILLGLNTGATQIDVATLEHEHVDLSVGILKRPRNKTGVSSEFVLWPETVVALKAVKTNPRHSKQLILAPDGQHLVRFNSKPDGRMVKLDSVAARFRPLLNRCGITEAGLGFKHLRKTSADFIAQKFPPHCVDQFLAHTTSAMRKHYAGEHLTPEFRAALEYLRTTYNLTEAKP